MQICNLCEKINLKILKLLLQKRFVLCFYVNAFLAAFYKKF